MNWLKAYSNVLLFIISLIISVVFANLAASFYLKKVAWDEQFFDLYTKQIEKTNHVRGLKEWKWDYRSSPREIIYSEIIPFADQTDRILVQGDSWAEQLSLSKKSRQVAKAIAIKNNAGLVNAGTSSYSVSPITVQLKTLIEDFELKPTKIITFFDQTDMGDELCRYKEQLVFNSEGNLLRVMPFPATSMELYTVSGEIRRQKIYQNPNLPSLMKLALTVSDAFANRELRYGDERKCGWSSISSYLKSPINTTEKSYLIERFHEYFKVVFEYAKVEHLYLAVHKHKDHFANRSYVSNISDLVRDAVNHSKYSKLITVIDGPESYLEPSDSYDFDKYFRQDDPASHLTDQAHKEFTEHIFSKVFGM